MTLPVVGLPEAAELKKAVAWYIDIRPELGTRFALAVDEAIAKIARNPHHFTVIKNNRRRAAVHRFPHGSSSSSSHPESSCSPASTESETLAA